MSESYGWLTESGALALFDDFPLPLAIARDGGDDAIVNRRFKAVLGAQALASEPLRGLLRNPDRRWRVVQLQRPDGGALAAQALAMPARGEVLLVVEESPDLLLRERVDELQARIAGLERTSSTDPLTGAWNRAHFDRILPGEIAKSLRSRQPVSLLMLDIDHFKAVNDTWGHAAGDAVLCELVRIAAGSMRLSDLLFRWGGEEFVVLAPDTGRLAATTLAEKLRTAVATHEIPGVGRVTISLGVAEHAGVEPAAEWFARADAALYAAKREGRDRVVTDARGNSATWAAEGGASVLRLDWQDGHACGHPVIDAQHRRLFELANAVMASAISRDGDPRAFGAALDALAGHVATHFRDEEAILAAAGYRRLEGHAQAHARLLARTRELQVEVAKGRATFGELIDFVVGEVVARHLLTADRDYFELIARDAATGKGDAGA